MALTLPDTANLGDTGHISDHNLITTALGTLETDLAAKAPSANPTFTGTVALPSTTTLNGTTLTPGGLILIGTPTTFTNANSVSLSSVFNSTYDNYRVVFQCAASTNSVLRMRLRDGGGDLTGATHSYGSGGFDAGAGTQNFGASSQTSFNLGYASTLRTAACLDIISPNLAQHTQISGTTEVINSADTVYVAGIFGGVFAATTQCTGISIYPTSGTFTGTVALYGYRKA